MAVSARGKTRGQGSGTGYEESGKRGVWKTRGVEKTKTKTVFVNKYLPHQWLWTKFRRHASLPKLQREKVRNSDGGHKEPP